MSKTIEILRYLKSTSDGETKMRIRGELFSFVDDIPDVRVQRVIRRSIADMVEKAGGIERLMAEGLIDSPAEPQEADLSTEELIEPAVEPPALAERAIKVDYSEIEESIEEKPNLNEVNRSDEGMSQSQSAFLNSLRGQETTEPPSQDNSLIGRFRAIQNRPIPSRDELLPKLDIGSQINEILQAKIEKMPTLADRQIELRSKFGGELVFIVDGESYESVNDIPAGEAADVMRSAIAQWNSN